MQVTRACAEDLNECVQAAENALRGLDDSVLVLRWEVLSDEDRREEGQRCVDEASRLWGSVRAIAGRLGLWPAVGELVG